MGAVKKAASNPLRAAAAIGTFGTSELAMKGLGINPDDEQGAYMTPEQKAQKEAQAYYSDYDKNMGAATKGVQEGALTKDLFGQGGLQSQLAKEQSDLSSQGFNLTQDDREAYGQTSGDISRLFGQQEQQATQNLARRGLASSDSGAAGATFSGIQGNKNEMLAQAQTSIAQKRMASTQSRLADIRSQMQSLSQQGVGAANQQWGQKGSSLSQAAGGEMAINDQKRQTLADQQAAIKPGLFSTIGQGLQRGIGQMAQAAPGMALGAATGGGSMAASGASGAMSQQNQPAFNATSYESSGMSGKSNPYNKTGYSLFGSR